MTRSRRLLCRSAIKMKRPLQLPSAIGSDSRRAAFGYFSSNRALYRTISGFFTTDPPLYRPSVYAQFSSVPFQSRSLIAIESAKSTALRNFLRSTLDKEANTIKSPCRQTNRAGTFLICDKDKLFSRLTGWFPVLSQCRAQRAALFKSSIIRCFICHHAVRDHHRAGTLCALLPVAHPLSVAPSV